MRTEFTSESFRTAQENMAYDTHLLDSLAPGHRHIRLYQWQYPGLTYRNGLDLPLDLHQIDHSARPTGGGIVFHAPNDLVFSVCSWTDDPAFDKALKNKMKMVQNWFKTTLNHLGINTQPSQDTDTNIQYCASYANPFELTYNTQKCLAITLKRHRKKIIIQGVCHIHTNRSYFDPKYAPFLTDGLAESGLTFETLTQQLTQQFKNLIQ